MNTAFSAIHGWKIARLVVISMLGLLLGILVFFIFPPNTTYISLRATACILNSEPAI